mgnify:CR=1 FL=1|tara:strand:- start:1482 stop:2174 length:693 start_codon:yes stop_codon:yes gene_type:complete
MSITLIFIAAVILISGIWLVRQGVMTKPWLETGTAPAMTASQVASGGRIWLSVVLAIIGSLFALFGSAFVMRMEVANLQKFDLPPLIWGNTAVLLLASVLLHLSVAATRRSDPRNAHMMLRLALLATIGFLAGQLLVWRALADAGHNLTTGPAASFFYLLSGLHGLHIVAGVGVLALIATQTHTDPQRFARRTRQCATYWDFLAFIWLGLLALFMGLANHMFDVHSTSLS